MMCVWLFGWREMLSAFFITQICCKHTLEVEVGENKLLATLLKFIKRYSVGCSWESWGISPAITLDGIRSLNKLPQFCINLRNGILGSVGVMPSERSSETHQVSLKPNPKFFRARAFLRLLEVIWIAISNLLRIFSFLSCLSHADSSANIESTKLSALLHLNGARFSVRKLILLNSAIYENGKNEIPLEKWSPSRFYLLLFILELLFICFFIALVWLASIIAALQPLQTYLRLKSKKDR